MEKKMVVSDGTFLGCAVTHNGSAYWSMWSVKGVPTLYTGTILDGRAAMTSQTFKSRAEMRTHVNFAVASARR